MTASINTPLSTEFSMKNTPTSMELTLSLSPGPGSGSGAVQIISHQQQFPQNNDDESMKPASITPCTTSKSVSENTSRTSEPSPSISDHNLLFAMPKSERPSSSEFAAIETFVVNAVQSQEPAAPGAIVDPSHVEGYRGIIMALKRPNDPAVLRKVLIALRTAGHGRVLNQLLTGDSHAQLIHLIIRFASTRKPSRLEEAASGDSTELLSVYDDHSLCDAHFQLLLAMVSAKSTNVVPVLRAVWKLLTAYGPVEESLSQRIHSMLYNILRLVPKSSSDLFPIIAEKFPFWTRHAEDLVWYTRQSIRVLDYLPSIQQKIFELLIDKCLEIDVNICIKDNGDVVIEEEEGPRTAHEDAGQDKETTTPGTVSKDVTVDELSDKLDALLELLFQRIQAASKNTVAGSRLVFNELLPIFETSILTTHKSKFVQYVMFLSCGLESQARESKKLPFSDVGRTEMDISPIWSDLSTGEHVGGEDEEDILHRNFASRMLDILVDPYRAVTTRQTCACYLASFISRASFVCAETVCESVSTLLRWAEAYIGSLDPSYIRAPDAREQSERHAVFYTVCQAAFYIMCFRGREAMQYFQKVVANKHTLDGQFHEYANAEFMNLNSDRWTFLCGHSLQPLRFCLESVRSEFLHVAHFFNLVEQKVLQDLVADAKRLSTGRVNKKAASTIATAATLERGRQNGGVGGLGRGSNPLKSFFPFDPLLLRRSHEFVEPLYSHWQGPVEEDDVLVIDSIEGCDTEAIFEMDEAMGDSDKGTSEESDDDDDDSDDESEDGEIVARNFSEVASCPETNEEDPIYGSLASDGMRTPDINERKLLQQRAWTESLKRPRSQSMENGSW